MTSYKTSKSLILASASPRRAELLQQIAIPFSIAEHSANETRLKQESPEQYVLRVGLQKAQSVLAQRAYRNSLVLASDTTVVLGNETLGKPKNEDDAVSMLLSLSERSHEVFSSVALADSARNAVLLSRTQVRFRVISESEAHLYWATGEPIGKAGGYGIQGRAAVFIEQIIGSYSGVMGLPLFETASLLRQFGVLGELE